MKNVIAATMATLAEFPDRTLYGEDVIWSGTPEEGMLSSHELRIQRPPILDWSLWRAHR